MKKLALLFIALLSVSALADDLPRIAVYVTGNVGDDEKKALGTRMLASLINSKRYKGIERSNSFLAEIEKEQEKQMSGDIDDNQISALGKQFGVKFVCIADITPAYGSFQVSARIINVETAEVDFIGDATSKLKTIDDLTQVSETVVRKMLGDDAVATAAPRKSGISVSAGGGAFFAGDFGGGISWKNGGQVAMPYLGGGAYLFFDAVYAEAFLGYSMGGGKWASDDAAKQNNLPDMPRSYVNFGAFGKYPLDLGSVTVFPLLGIDYEASVSGKLTYGDGKEYTGNRPDASALSALWVKFGGGIDFDFNQNVYLRSELLYGLRTANKFENDCAEVEGGSVDTRIGHGLALKIGVGVKF